MTGGLWTKVTFVNGVGWRLRTNVTFSQNIHERNNMSVRPSPRIGSKAAPAFCKHDPVLRVLCHSFYPVGVLVLRYYVFVCIYIWNVFFFFTVSFCHVTEVVCIYLLNSVSLIITRSFSNTLLITALISTKFGWFMPGVCLVLIY